MIALMRDPKCHDLKTWRQPFKAMWEGRKSYEIRRTEDRNFRACELVLLREYNEAHKVYTGRFILGVIEHVDHGTWDLPKYISVFSVRILHREGIEVES